MGRAHKSAGALRVLIPVIPDPLPLITRFQQLLAIPTVGAQTVDHVLESVKGLYSGGTLDSLLPSFMNVWWHPGARTRVFDSFSRYDVNYRKNALIECLSAGGMGPAALAAHAQVPVDESSHNDLKVLVHSLLAAAGCGEPPAFEPAALVRADLNKKALQDVVEQQLKLLTEALSSGGLIRATPEISTTYIRLLLYHASVLAEKPDFVSALVSLLKDAPADVWRYVKSHWNRMLLFLLPDDELQALLVSKDIKFELTVTEKYLVFRKADVSMLSLPAMLSINRHRVSTSQITKQIANEGDRTCQLW